MPKVCMHYIVTGFVQAVWYRSAAQKQAKDLSIAGWVRNTNDGNVEVLACGEQEKIAQFEKWLWQGPMFAKVKSVIAKELPWQKHEDFVICDK